MTPLILETNRLMLRVMDQEHFDAIYSIISNAETMRFYPRPYSADETKQWIERNHLRHELYGGGCWAAHLKPTGQCVGDCGLVFQNVEELMELEVAYHFHPDFQNRGLATEAAQACMAYGFTHFRVDRIISMIRPENLPSRKVAEKNGLTIDRKIFWRGFDHYVYKTVRGS